jgi:hypothetical protein
MVLAKLRHRRFFSLGELNAAIGELIDELNNRTRRRIGSSRRALFEAIEHPAPQPHHSAEPHAECSCACRETTAGVQS